MGVTYCMIRSINVFDEVIPVRQEETPVAATTTTVRQEDTTRVEEGLPTDVTLSPEDFAANPELAEIFGITDTNVNLDIALESNEHFEAVQNQAASIDYFKIIYDTIEALVTFFN